MSASATREQCGHEAGDVIDLFEAEALPIGSIVRSVDGTDPWPLTRVTGVRMWRGSPAESAFSLRDRFQSDRQFSVLWVGPYVPEPMLYGAVSAMQLAQLPHLAIVVDMEGDAAQAWDTLDPAANGRWLLVGSPVALTDEQMVERCASWRLVWTQQHQSMIVFGAA